MLNGNHSNSGSEMLTKMLRVNFHNSNVVTGSMSPINFPTIKSEKDRLIIA